MHVHEGLIWFLVIGAVAGWLAGELWKGRSFGLLANCLIGVVGAFIGGHIFSYLGIATIGLLGTLVSALVGSLALLFVVSLLKGVA